LPIATTAPLSVAGASSRTTAKDFAGFGLSVMFAGSPLRAANLLIWPRPVKRG
jgi:hypothetical protein